MKQNTFLNALNIFFSTFTYKNMCNGYVSQDNKSTGTRCRIYHLFTNVTILFRTLIFIEKFCLSKNMINIFHIIDIMGNFVYIVFTTRNIKKNLKTDFKWIVLKDWRRQGFLKNDFSYSIFKLSRRIKISKYSILEK